MSLDITNNLVSLMADRQIRSAIVTLQNIPPDITVGELLIALDSYNFLSDAGELATDLDDQPDPVERLHKSGEETPNLKYSLEAFQGDQSYEKFLEVLSGAGQTHYWKELETVTTLLRVANQDLVRNHKLFLKYEEEDERLSLMEGRKVIYTLYGEDTKDELMNSVPLLWFEEPKDTEPGIIPGAQDPVALHGWVDISASLAEIPIEHHKVVLDFISQPKFVKIERLFESFYGSLGQDSNFRHRFERETGGVYITYMGVDLVSFNEANVSWPHKKVKKPPPNKWWEEGRARVVTRRPHVAATQLPPRQGVRPSSDSFYAPLLELSCE